jgi:hypothetical protein
MPVANSIPVPLNPVGRYPGHAPAATAKPKLLDRLREALRSRHYSRRTEQTYCHWVKRFIFFDTKRHPADMAEQGINAFLSHVDCHTFRHYAESRTMPSDHVSSLSMNDLVMINSA